MNRIILKIQVIWKIICSDKFFFFNIENQKAGEADVFKCIVGVKTKQDMARFLRNEASKLTWGNIHKDIKNLKI